MIELVLFVGGASLMALELTASRILSPYLGSSIYVWTAIIGVILAFLSFGYYKGGKFADSKLDRKYLANITFLTGVSILLCFILRENILKTIPAIFLDTRVASTIVTVFLFALPSFLFGMITPYATRLKIDKLSSSGEVVGRLYAISTVGSIFGTFITGYILLGYLGSGRILIALAFIMIIVSALIDLRNFFRLNKLLLIFFCTLLLNGQSEKNNNIVFEKDSNYQKIYVLDLHQKDTNRPIRLLRTSVLYQSGKYLDGDELLFDYTQQLSLVSHFAPNAKKMLFIGGGGYTLPSYFVKKNPQILVDVVEIDPEVTKVAEEYFNMSRERINTYSLDGRSFINRTNDKYDVIVLDAYRDEIVMPFELTTKQAVDRYKSLLTENGILAINTIVPLEGDGTSFFKAFIKTLKTGFGSVLIFRIHDNLPLHTIQNVILFAFSGKQSELRTDDIKTQKLLNKFWEGKLETNLPELTDEFAPIERYTLSVL